MKKQKAILKTYNVYFEGDIDTEYENTPIDTVQAFTAIEACEKVSKSHDFGIQALYAVEQSLISQSDEV